ncbi:tetratricopeptide repeat protein [Skeletonema marinoi]|uniref:Tetratricopeptide repeat protein n=1 Tax=Skeletonema marinoi TaxID=267567 RepID=A0AAD9DHX2_9STRA|nr:tetratricopeptide repeat protein [Skeletonema marinoi]
MMVGDRALASLDFQEASKNYNMALQSAQEGTMTGDDFKLRPKMMVPTINLAKCLRELARYKEAEDILTKYIKDAKDPPIDTRLHARVLSTLAELYQAQSKYDAAAKLHKQAVSMVRGGTPNLELAGSIAGYAETLRKSGDLPQAELHHREALAIRTRAVEEKSCTELELAVSYTQLGCTLAGMHKHNEAYQQHHRALGLRYRYLDFSHGLVSESMNYCAESLCALGKGVEGIPLALHAVEIRKTIFGTTHPAYAHALSILASCYQSVGRSFDARDCLEKCLEICEVAFQRNHANIIPNLMNYGNVLRSTGDLKKARTVYQRAIAIHQLNFKEGQQASRLEKCRAEVDKLKAESERRDSCSSGGHSSVEDLSSLRIHPEPHVSDSMGTPVIVFTDIGRDVDDEMALVLLSALRRKHLLDPKAVIATLSPVRDRANLARGSLDVLGMADVLLASGALEGLSRTSRFIRQFIQDQVKVLKTVASLLHAMYSRRPTLTSLSDLAVLIKDHEELFISKVKEVVVMGGLLPIDSHDKLVPDTAYNNNCDMEAARFVYESCQELCVPTVTLSRWTAYGCPMRPELLDELARTEHMVATNIRKKSKESIDQLWKKVVLPPDDPGREKLPSRCDAKWFYKTFIGKELPAELPTSVWNDVEKLNMYDPLAVLMCVSSYRSTHFRCTEKVVNEVSHLVVGVCEQENGIRNRKALFDEYSALFLYAMQASLYEPKININYNSNFVDEVTSKRSALVNRAA